MEFWGWRVRRVKDGLYKIGDVSAMFKISVQTLRFYEKTGLFVPAVKEESSGYRYYSWEQFERLRQILFLRDFGLRLKDIKHQLDVQNSAQYMTLLENYSHTLERRIQSDIKLKQYIDIKTENMKLAADLPHNETLFLHFSDQKVLKHECTISHYKGFHKIELAIIELINRYNLKSNIDSVGQFFSRESLTNDSGELITSGLFVTEAAFTEDTYNKAGNNIIIIPEGLYAVMYYRTPTHQSLPYIRKLLDDIGRHSFVPCGNIVRSIIFDLGRENSAKDGYLACIRVLVRENSVV